VRKADNLPPSCAVVTKSGSLNFLEPSGPVQACNGTDLPFCTVLRSSEMSDVCITHNEITALSGKREYIDSRSEVAHDSPTRLNLYDKPNNKLLNRTCIYCDVFSGSQRRG